MAHGEHGDTRAQPYRLGLPRQKAQGNHGIEPVLIRCIRKTAVTTIGIFGFQTARHNDVIGDKDRMIAEFLCQLCHLA